MVKHISKCCKGFPKDLTSEELKDILRESYLLWPKPYPNIEDLINSGFFYTGSEDAVTCVSCEVTLDDWQPEDVPDEEHRKASPKCSLMSKP